MGEYQRETYGEVKQETNRNRREWCSAHITMKKVSFNRELDASPDRKRTSNPRQVSI
jgi:hypothetical protein